MRHGTWTSWSGLAEAHPARVLSPMSTAEVADAVVAARANGLTVKMVGSGHSFTDIAVTDGLLLRPDRLVGVTSVDRDAMTVSVSAGTPLHVLNDRLADLGLALHNMGDIDRQTVAGAIATGTHGSGGVRASLGSQVVALEMVVGDGSVLRVGEETGPDLLAAARVGLGALGIVTEVTFAVEPAFRLEAVERPMRWAALLAGYDELVDANHHVDVHWFPGTDRALVKLNNRTVDDAAPLPRVRGWVDDELLSNRVFGLMNRLANRVPGTVPVLNQVAARALSGREYVDASHRVFVSERKVRFREMEYAVPRAAGMSALREAAAVMERGGWPVTFPVEIRCTPPDDAWLSTAHDRESVYLAFHVNAQSDHTAFFAAVEPVLRDHEGRPHWGKLHTLAADDLAPGYPRWADFQEVRDRLDPERVFTNRHLDRVLGRSTRGA